MVTLEGTTLGHCRIERLLGKGGMAAVYLAQHLTLDKKVAVKVLSGPLAADKDYVARFLREARSAAKLDHPNVVPVLDAGSNGDVHYMVMQLVEGADLDTYLKKQGKLSVKDTISIGKRIALALEAAHALGLIHRDIKPSNVMIGKGSKVLVADFGLAREVGGNLELTRTDVVVGSPHYMSPEQATGEKLDGRTDIYSLGATLYHMLAGRPPYEGPTVGAIMVKHASSDHAPTPLSQISREVPPDLEALILRMMAKKREDRPPTMRAVIEGLEGIGKGTMAPTVLAPPVKRPVGSLIVAAGIAAAVLLAAAAAWALWPESKPAAEAIFAEAQQLEKDGKLEAAVARYRDVPPGTTFASIAQQRIPELEARMREQRGEARLESAMKAFRDGDATLTATIAELKKIKFDYSDSMVGERAEDAVVEAHRTQVGRRAQALADTIESHEWTKLVAFVDPAAVRDRGEEAIRKVTMESLVGSQRQEGAPIESVEPLLDRTVVQGELTAFVPMKVVFKSKVTGVDETREMRFDWMFVDGEWYTRPPDAPARAAGEELMMQAQRLEREAGDDLIKLQAAIAKYRDVVDAAPTSPLAVSAKQKIKELQSKIDKHASSEQVDALLKNFKDGTASFGATRSQLDRLKANAALEEAHRIQLTRRAEALAAALTKRDYDTVIAMTDPRATKGIDPAELRKQIAASISRREFQVVKAELVPNGILLQQDKGTASVKLNLTLKPRIVPRETTREDITEWTLGKDDWYYRPSAPPPDRPKREP